MNSYFGAYQRFETVSKKEAAILLGADNLVGDVFEIVFHTENGVQIAWLKNRFEKEIGFFDAAFSRQLNIMAARGWTLRALLSFVAYTDIPEPGHYWGEVAVVCYDSKYENAFAAFINGVAAKMVDGARPDIALGEQGVSRVINTNGEWVPDQTVAMPEKETGTVIMKSRRSISEKMIEQGRKGNKGCYVVSWAFLLLIVAAIIFGLKSCGVF